jgi:hypothetical protein
MTKGDKEAQYGLLINFETPSKRQFYNINLHLNGGKTEKDKDVRK